MVESNISYQEPRQNLQELRYDPKDVLTVAKNEAIKLRPNFEYDKETEEAFKKLSLYFANDPAFETQGYGSLQKGLLLVGNVGVGKSFLFNCFKNNPRGKIQIVSTNDIATNYQKGGIEGIERYFGGRYSDGRYSIAPTVFDDLGSEETSLKYMGSPLNVMEKIILCRYENGQPFHKTHFTTNLTGDEIETAYGSRVRSRLREMINNIILTGKDRRK